MVRRNADGTVKPGSVLNPAGRKPKETEGEFRDAVKSAFTTKQVIEVITMLHTRAVKYHDIPAAKIWLEYVVGKVQDEVVWKGELKTQEVMPIDNYRAAITPLAPGSMGDSAASSEDQSFDDGTPLG